MKKSCAIVQSNYIPWKGYFDLINSVDEFVLFDCVQYTKRDWRNRNKIKTPNGLAWLSIPVQIKGNYHAPIDSILTEGSDWAESHWQTLLHNYAKAPCFREYSKVFQTCYETASKVTELSKVNEIFIRQICQCLNIKTRITHSSNYEIQDGKTTRLLSICQQLGANIYYSGPSARGYFDTSEAESKNIEVRWMNYDNYSEYPQLFPPFVHSVSAIDLLFNLGNDATRFMNSFASSTQLNDEGTIV